MAGIGFRLQKLLSEDTYTSLLKGYVYSAIISSGPMIASILCIGFLGVISFNSLSTQDFLVFKTTIIYIFAFSVIFTGIFQMVTTRYVADRLFMKEPHSLIPCFIGLMIITSVIQALAGSVFFYHIGYGWRYVVVSVYLYIIISGLWNIMIFISATKNYNIIVLGFIIGSLVSFIAGYYMGAKFGLNGYLLGFALGQFLIFIVLLGSFIREFDFFVPLDFNFTKYFAEYPDLMAVGVIINLGVWADKFMFWFSPYGTQIKGMFHSFPMYDSAFFIAYLSIIPALSIFLARVETSFYKKYKQFYRLVIGKANLNTIENAKNDIVSDLRESVMILLKVQGAISVVLIAGALNIMRIAKLQWAQIFVFKIGVLGSFILIMFQILLIIMFYFEFRKEALTLAVLFMLLNIAATFLTIQIGFCSFGYGFFLASFISLFAGYFLLNYKMDNLEFITFVKQPVYKVKV